MPPITAVAAILVWFACTRNPLVAGKPIVVKWDKPFRMCGSQLMNYVQKFCDGHYNDLVIQDSFNVANYHTRKITGITDECCSVPCTTRHIYENYCPGQNYDTSQDLILPDAPTTTTTGTDVKRGTTTTTTTSTTTSTTTHRPSAVTKLVCPEFGDQYPGGEEAWFSIWKSLGCPF